MMIWAILILTTIYTFASSALAGNYAQVTEAARQSAKRVGISAGASVTGCSMALVAWAITACWVIYAVQVNDWRFATIALVPKAMGVLVHLARPKHRVEIVR